MSGGRGRGRIWNHNQEPWHPGQGPNFHPYYGHQHHYNPRQNFRGGYGYSQPPPAFAFNPRLPPPTSHQHHYSHHRQDNGYNYKRGGGYKDRSQRQQPRSRPSTPSVELQRSQSSTPSIENLTSIESTEEAPPDINGSDENITCSGLPSRSFTSEAPDENVNDVSSSQLKDNEIERMETPQSTSLLKESNPKDGNNNKDSEGMDENQKIHIKPGCPDMESQTERLRTSIETKTKAPVRSSDIKYPHIPHPSNNSNQVSGVPNNDNFDNYSEETVLRQKVKMDKVYVWDFAMTSNDLANVGWGKSPRTPRAVQAQTENKEMGDNYDGGTSVKEELPEDARNGEADEIDYEDVEVDCDPESVLTDSDDESSESKTSEIPQGPMPSRLNSPEPQVHSTSSFETPENKSFEGFSEKDPDATVPFGLGIEEMHLASLLGQSGSEKGVMIQGKKKTAAQKIKELKELGRKRAAKTIELEKINKDIGVLLKLHRKKTAEMKALQREEKTVMNA